MKDVERGLARDIEPGCFVACRQIEGSTAYVRQDSRGPVCGHVVKVIRDEPDYDESGNSEPAPLRFQILRWPHGMATLDELGEDEIELRDVRYFPAGPSKEAKKLVKWMAKHENTDPLWTGILDQFAQLGQSGTFLPKAEGRYIAARDAEQRAREENR